MYDLLQVRRQFPALEVQVNGQPAGYFDGPGGTQAPEAVIEAQQRYFSQQNSNRGGAYLTSKRTDEVVRKGRSDMAAFLGADPEEIAFGANMTTLTFRLSRALARQLEPGDEILITDLDHEANRDPWLALRQQGIKVKTVRINKETCTLDMDDFREKLTSKTRIAAVGYASNAVGTINDLVTIRKLTDEVGATMVVDAVHYVPHKPVDVHELGCDYLLCSAYKFFGPHVGVLYGRKEAFSKLQTYRVRPQKPEMPYKMETGTANFEGIAGTSAAVHFIASLSPMDEAEALREQILKGMRNLDAHETELAGLFRRELQNIKGVQIYNSPEKHPQTPTIALTKDGVSPREMAAHLGDLGLFVWDGHFYALTLIEKLGLFDSGGVVRVGMAPYNSKEEVHRLLEGIESA